MKNIHLYDNPPSLSQQKLESMALDNDDDCMKVPRIIPKHVNVNLPPSLRKAQIHLVANILSSHNADLLLFDDITSWVRLHSEDGRVNWEGSEWLSHEKLLHNMKSILRTEAMHPKKKCPLEIRQFIHLSSSF